jgi:hypothetical protein
VNIVFGLAVALGVYLLAREDKAPSAIDPNEAAKDPASTLGGDGATAVNANGSIVQNVPAVDTETKSEIPFAPVPAPTKVVIGTGIPRQDAGTETFRSPIGPTTDRAPADEQRSIETAIRTTNPELAF